jgi:type I restriction enzyme, R subunit
LGGYEAKDVEGLLKDRLKKGKDDLDTALEAIRALCEPVEPPKDASAYIKFFCGNSEKLEDLKDTEPKRVALYKAVLAVFRAYAKISDEMSAAGYTDKETEKIKNELKHYEKLREQIQLASGDYIDLKQFEPAMRHLIDSYIDSEDSRVLANFDNLGLVELLVEKGKDALDDLPDEIKNNQDAMAETIENNMRKVIIEESPANPMYYEKMSILLDELIKLRKEKSIEYEQYLNDFIDLSGKVVTPSQKTIYPTSINTSAKMALYDNLGNNEDLANQLDSIIISTKKDGWRNHPQKSKAVRLAIEKILGEFDISAEDETQRIFELATNQKDY